MLKLWLDNLNPLYIYEAKMSLFTQLAQSRAGAERLVDLGIVSTLAKCEFLEAQPSADHSFTGTVLS
jgi:nuclear pore complex protein Nup205